jgi:hypothetical protein
MGGWRVETVDRARKPSGWNASGLMRWQNARDRRGCPQPTPPRDDTLADASRLLVASLGIDPEVCHSGQRQGTVVGRGLP